MDAGEATNQSVDQGNKWLKPHLGTVEKQELSMIKKQILIINSNFRNKIIAERSQKHKRVFVTEQTLKQH